MKKISALVLVLPLLLLQACSTRPVVRYGDAKSVETVSTEFGSTDLQQIAESMSTSMLSSNVIASARETPIITVSDVRNKTTEYIDTRIITDKIRTQMTRSGRVRFAVSVTEMQNQVDELKRQNQSGLYAQQTRSQMGNMTGARYRVDGSISSIVKQNKEIRDVFYIFNLTLINIETGLVEWADEKEIRKTAER